MMILPYAQILKDFQEPSSRFPNWENGPKRLPGEVLGFEFSPGFPEEVSVTNRKETG